MRVGDRIVGANDIHSFAVGGVLVPSRQQFYEIRRNFQT